MQLHRSMTWAVLLVWVILPRQVVAEPADRFLSAAAQAASEVEDGLSRIHAEVVAGAHEIRRLVGVTPKETRDAFKLADEIREEASQRVSKLKDQEAKASSAFPAKLRKRKVHHRTEHSRARAGRSAEAQEAPFANLRPLAWMHVPKCGTSLINTLMHLPGVCRGIPNDLLMGLGVRTVDFKDYERAHPNATIVHVATITKFKNDRGLDDKCRGGLTSPLQYPWYAHYGMGPYYEKNKGRIVLMLRQPEQRILSSWYHSDPHGTLSLQGNAGKINSVKDYAKVVSGCVVKMLTRGGVSMPLPCGDAKPPSRQEMDLAVRRLSEGVAFVGLVEEWALSISLLHKMFGGTCEPYELLNLRPGAHRRDTGYDVSELDGFVDKYDRVIYNFGNASFQRNVMKYGAYKGMCRKQTK